jgi:ribokinase
VVRAARLPAPGETVLGDDLLRTPGGKGANQAVAAARLGAAVSFIGAVGADPFGTELSDALHANGVDVSNLMTIANRPSGTALIVVNESGENQIAVAPGANSALSPSNIDAALRDMTAADALLVQLEVPIESVHRACQLGSVRGAHVILNAAPAARLESDLLALVDVLVVNSGEALLLSQQEDVDLAAAVLRTLGPSVVMVTLGADGLRLLDSDGSTRIPAHRVRVVDTTAAGDAFCGALAAALVDGRSRRAAADFANTAAALATTRMGAQASLPSRAEVDAAYRNTPLRSLLSSG